MVDELRSRLSEQVDRGQFKTAPPSADEHVASMLAQASRPVRGVRQRGAGMSVTRAQRMADDLAEYDAKLAKGEVEA